MTGYVDTRNFNAEGSRPPVAVGALRTLIVGLGRMGMFHADLIAHHVPELEVVALADTRQQVVEQAATLFPGAVRSQDAFAALEQTDLKACVVATSTAGHKAIVEAALARGLHTFCEKPITLDPQDVKYLSRIASIGGLTLQTGFWRRFSPAWVSTREEVHRGAVGTPLFVRSSQWDASAPPLAFCDRSVSGGLFVDCGVHEFDIIEWVTGRQITALTAVPMALANDEIASVNDVDNGLLLLEMEGRTVGIVDITRNGGYVDEVRMEVLGTEGSILVTTEPYGRAVLRTKAGVEEITQPTTMPAFDLGVIAELRAFAARSRGIDVAVPGGLEDARALQLALAAWESRDLDGRRTETAGSSFAVTDESYDRWDKS